MPQQPTATALVHPASPSWHTDPDCNALDNAQFHGDKVEKIPAEQTADRRPCLVCADDPGTEWTITADNLGELWELIGPSKPHTSTGPDGTLVTDGLTILPHGRLQRRQLARIGDTIRLVGREYHVITRTPQEA